MKTNRINDTVAPAARYVGDPWDGLIDGYLEMVTDVSVDEILRDVIHLDVGRWTQVELNRVSRCLSITVALSDGF